MADGSDAIADWPLLNAMVNVASGASWVSIHHGGGVGIGRSIHAGQVTVADGTALAGEKLARVLTNDPGTGVIRHADAGYDEASRWPRSAACGSRCGSRDGRRAGAADERVVCEEARGAGVCVRERGCPGMAESWRVGADVAEGLEGLLDGRRLSPVQRRIAHYLGEHLAEAIFLSSVELAERAGVSQPSVTRFAMVLGFAGYPELRQALRPLVLARAAGGAEEPRGPALAPRSTRRSRNLAAVRDRAGAASADRGARRQRSPPREPLPVLGLRVSAGLATTFAYYARRIHPDVRLFVHGGSELADGLHAARRAGAEWLLAVALPRYPAEIVHALEYADKLGLRIATITDRPECRSPPRWCSTPRSATGSSSTPTPRRSPSPWCWWRRWPTRRRCGPRPGWRSTSGWPTRSASSTTVNRPVFASRRPTRPW